MRNVNKKVGAYYNHLQMDACNYQFDSQNQLVKQSGYANFSWGNSDCIKSLRADLSEFALHTNFRQFYKAHQDYYAMLIAQMELQSPILKQKKWLDAHFKTEVNRYFIYFSPLSRGLHCTNVDFAKKNKTVLVWVSSPFLIDENKYSAEVKESLITRMFFTEIDHNYINPLSDKHLKAIKIAFRKRKMWASGGFTQSYTNPYSVWNEYMTWGLYLLYAKQHFSPETYSFISNNVIAQMEKSRGFVHFGKFYAQLFAIYTKNQDIENCYPAMLEWAKNENN